MDQKSTQVWFRLQKFINNVWVKKTETNCGSVSLPQFVSVFLTQTLCTSDNIWTKQTLSWSSLLTSRHNLMYVYQLWRIFSFLCHCVITRFVIKHTINFKEKTYEHRNKNAISELILTPSFSFTRLEPSIVQCGDLLNPGMLCKQFQQ